MKSHLSPEEFVDALDGAAPARASAHLAACEACRTELAEVRALVADAASLEASEPSPLFWDHFSARVKEATTREAVPAGWTPGVFGWKPIAALLVTAGALAVGFYTRSASPSRSAEMFVADVRQTGSDVRPMPALEDDGSLGVVTALAGDMDWSELRLAVAPVEGTADSLIDELSADQREALARLLQKEIGDF
jgi:hypothetical protein